MKAIYPLIPFLVFLAITVGLYILRATIIVTEKGITKEGFPFIFVLGGSVILTAITGAVGLPFSVWILMRKNKLNQESTSGLR